MIDDSYFNRLYSELMSEQIILMNDIKNGSIDERDKVKNKQRQISTITAILNNVSKLRDLRVIKND